MNTLEIQIQYHRQSLDTCKQLFKEKRYKTAWVIIELLEKNIDKLEDLFFKIQWIHYAKGLDKYLKQTQLVNFK